MTKFSV